MFVFGLVVLIGCLVGLYVDFAHRKTFDIGHVLTTIYVLITLTVFAGAGGL